MDEGTAVSAFSLHDLGTRLVRYSSYDDYYQVVTEMIMVTLVETLSSYTSEQDPLITPTRRKHSCYLSIPYPDPYLGMCSIVCASSF